MQEASLAEVQPGTIIFGPIGGFVPGVFPVGVGQLLLKAATRETWKLRHVLVCVEGAGGGHGPKAVQAMPNGAEEIELTDSHWTPEYRYVLPAYMQQPDARSGQQYDVARAARSLIGTPYSFLDYAALTEHAVVGGGYKSIEERTRLERYIADTGHQICSQLADECLKRAGFHVFNDGRLPQDVMPSALYVGLRPMAQSIIIPA